MNDIILSGVDGSPTAAKAAEIAASLATDLKCDLHLISAYQPSSFTLQSIGLGGSASKIADKIAALQESEASEARGAQKIADDVAAQLRQTFPDLAITSAGIEAEPAQAIIEEAERLDARLVVVGNKHVQGINRILGSVASAVARNIKTDLYVAHTRDS